MFRGLTLLIARLSITGIFLFAAISKFIFYDATFQYMASKHMSMIPFFLIGAALVELIGSLSIIFGYKARWGALLLLLFLVPTTLIFHDFWNIKEPLEQHMQMIMFLKNLAIFGGLLYIATYGAGKWACDCCSSHSCNLSKDNIRRDV